MTSSATSEPEIWSNSVAEPGSYTALRLEHASAEHIHLTSRRCFIGPIPEGWLKSHRKSWYKRYLTASTYSSRAATFSTQSDVSHHRQITGLDGPSASATLGHSFPQPEDVDEEESDDDAADSGDGGSAGNLENEEEVHDLEPQSIVGGDGTSNPEATSPAESPKRGLPRSSTFKDRFLSPGPPTSRKGVASSFVTAPTTPQKPLKSKFESVKSAKTTSSFVTARETPSKPIETVSEENKTPTPSPKKLQPPQMETPSPGSGTQPRSSMGDPLDQGTATDSATQLLPHEASNTGDGLAPSASMGDELAGQKPQPMSRGMVRFNLEDKPDKIDASHAAKVGQEGRRRIWRRLRQGSTHPGEIVKVEKMLVRVDSTMEKLPPDYNENDSLKTSSRTVEKWREFVVVCRESTGTTEDADFSIQMYRTRVIPSKENTHVKKRSAHEIALTRKSTNVNLYSSLDKTLVIWTPWKMGTMMYIMRTHSVSSAVEWYTFIRQSLGMQRSNALQVNVPDLSVALQLENPFTDLEAAISGQLPASKTIQAEKAVAGSIIQRSIDMMEGNPEWTDILQSWVAREKIGLAWKRYDRLEWIHGANEQRMYGTLAMQQTHDLELRPKVHYPTSCNYGGQAMDGQIMEEPTPIEGFLIRLTSQKGHARRLGKMYFKRLYFTTHNQYLCYCRPAKCQPPPPPRSSLGSSDAVPSASEIVEKTPLIYAINPYPLKAGNVEWLQQGGTTTRARHDEDAYKEAERMINTMLEAEGYINLSHVIQVQDAQRGSSPVDADVDQGPDVDFHEEVADTRRDDGKTQQFDEKRTFELVMKNKLVIRLQAYNEIAKKEWIARLRQLVQYWKLRLADDMALLKKVRAQNLQALEIDEESEAFLGQFGSKWEVTRSVASPRLFNMCGIACCRAITMSGTLYRKPKRHSTFQRCGVILCHGRLLIFHGTLRETSGKEVPHIQHDRQASIDLRDCYIYSGLVTEGDLLYQNQTFDSNHPGHHALPKVYLEDGWTSIDEDTMTCFVIWQPQTRSFFKSSEEQDSGRTRQRLKYVSRLGVPGRSIVFKARSRAERDHWVMSIGIEIDRLQGGDDIRVVDKKP